MLSTAGDAVLTVSDPSPTAPGRLVNGAYALAQPLRVAGSPLPATVKAWAGARLARPGDDRPRPDHRRQRAAADGRYAKTLTFTLSTTLP